MSCDEKKSKCDHHTILLIETEKSRNIRGEGLSRQMTSSISFRDDKEHERKAQKVQILCHAYIHAFIVRLVRLRLLFFLSLVP